MKKALQQMPKGLKLSGSQTGRFSQLLYEWWN